MASSSDEKVAKQQDGIDIISAEQAASKDSLPDYEEAVGAVGAPTEKISPLGYHVDWMSVIFLVSELCISLVDVED